MKIQHTANDFRKLADGFETEVFPRAETSEMVLQISEKLRLDAAEDRIQN